MTPLTYRVRAKWIHVSQGRLIVGRIIYREAFAGWCWSPINSTDRTPSRSTWPEVIPDVEAWFKEHPKDHHLYAYQG